MQNTKQNETKSLSCKAQKKQAGNKITPHNKPYDSIADYRQATQHTARPLAVIKKKGKTEIELINNFK